MREMYVKLSLMFVSPYSSITNPLNLIGRQLMSPKKKNKENYPIKVPWSHGGGTWIIGCCTSANLEYRLLRLKSPSELTVVFHKESGVV